jgi:hypothetical protein
MLASHKSLLTGYLFWICVSGVGVLGYFTFLSLINPDVLKIKEEKRS